jgi:hypothetical protein
MTRGTMPNKKSNDKARAKPGKVNREVRRRKTANIVFLVLCAILILSMLLAAVVKF